MDAHEMLGLRAVRLTSEASRALARSDFSSAYLALAESLNLQDLLKMPDELAERTRALMTDISAAVAVAPPVRQAEIARLKAQIALLESQSAILEREAALSVICDERGKENV